MNKAPAFIISLLALAIPTVSDAGWFSSPKLPGSTITDAKLQKDIVGMVQFIEKAFGSTCRESKVTDTEVLEPPGKVNVDPWVERWTLDRCGTVIRYRVELRPEPHGGTYFGIHLEGDKPAATTAPAAAESASARTPDAWSEVVRLSDVVFYVNFSSLTIHENLRSIDEDRDFAEPRPSGARSYFLRSEYDCAKARYRILSFRSYTQPMAAGDVVQQESGGEWITDFTATSPAAKIRETVCSHASMPAAASPPSAEKN